MGTATAPIEIVLVKAGEILGPGSAYERRRHELLREYGAPLDAAKAFTEIGSHEDAERATQLGRLLKVAESETLAYFKKVKLQIDDIKKPVLAAEKEDVGSYSYEKARIGVLQTEWDQKCAREQAERDRLAREEAQKQAQEDLLQQAIDAEERGEDADEVLAQPVYAVPVVTQVQSQPKIAGKVSKTTYSARVTNLMLLVKAVAEGKAPIQSLQPDESFINAQARSFKDGFSIPGCELQKATNTHYRG